MRHNQNEYTKFTQDKLGVVGLSYQNWLCRNTNARLFFTSKCCDMSNQVKKLNAAGLVVSGKLNPNWKGGKVKLRCSICRREFKVSISRSNAKYCSMQCVGISQRGKSKRESTKVTKQCEICSKEFNVYKCHANRSKCCSKECAFKRKSLLVKGENNPAWSGGLSKFPYTYDWLQVSYKIRCRDGHKCMNPKCTNHSGKGKIEGHHIDHDKSNNNFSNLITLCTVCNTKANFNRKYWVEFYRKILTDLYGY